jgi:hypothetical protein
LSWSNNVSPVDWYIASYIIRFIEVSHDHNDDPEKIFLVWENTILVKASNLDEAYDKTVQFASLNTNPYKGGLKGVDVQWVFEGVTELLPVYEDIEDGAEIMWSEYRRKLKSLRKHVRSKGEFAQKLR